MKLDDRFIVKQAKKDLKQLARTEIVLQYLRISGRVDGFNMANQTAIVTLKALVHEIDSFNIEKYQFADLKIGEILVFFPEDTEIPQNVKKIKYKGNWYQAHYMDRDPITNAYKWIGKK